MIKVVNKSRTKEPGVYIGRPSPIGNPFSHKHDTLANFRVKSREEAVENYRAWLVSAYDDGGLVKDFIDNLIEKYEQTGELTLVCWCKPLACHGDVVKEFINRLIWEKQAKSRDSNSI